MQFAPKNVLTFPDQINEVAARLVAGFVVVLSTIQLISGSGLILAFIAYGFAARTVAGPTLSPIAQLVTRVIVPRLPLAERPTAGPPKRFAQAIGATLSMTALVLHASGAGSAGAVLVAMIATAAALESGFGICVGCMIFARLIRIGVVPDHVCAACADLSLRPGWAEQRA